MIRQAWWIARKDLQVELRGRDAANVLFPFVGTLLVLFGLAFGPGRTALQASAPALLWLAVLFAGVLALRASFQAETRDDAIEGLLVAPVDRLAIYLGKVAAVSGELLALELMALLAGAVLFALPLGSDPLLVVGAFALGTVGFVALGVLFAALTVRARAREALLPTLLLPFAVPVLLAGIRTTALAMGGGDGQAAPWLGLLLAFTVGALALGALIFEHLVEEP